MTASSYSVHNSRQLLGGRGSDGIGARCLFISSQSALNVFILPFKSAITEEKIPNFCFNFFVCDFFFILATVAGEVGWSRAVSIMPISIISTFSSVKIDFDFCSLASTIFSVFGAITIRSSAWCDSLSKWSLFEQNGDTKASSIHFILNLCSLKISALDNLAIIKILIPQKTAPNPLDWRSITLNYWGWWYKQQPWELAGRFAIISDWYSGFQMLATLWSKLTKHISSLWLVGITRCGKGQKITHPQSDSRFPIQKPLLSPPTVVSEDPPTQWGDFFQFPTNWWNTK